jgi:steroid 5-alpha reductase family enzyme
MVLWAIRLGYHFYKRGYYKIGGEDYRWVHIKQNNPKWFVELNNFFTISYYQFQLALFYTSAFYYAKGETTIIDWLLVALCYAFAIGEAIADKQQSAFQNKKYELLNNGKKLE